MDTPPLAVRWSCDPVHVGLVNTGTRLLWDVRLVLSLVTSASSIWVFPLILYKLLWILCTCRI